MEIIAEGVSKKIHNRIILDEVNLSVHSGTVYGIVGRNGSGKTMLFRALSGLMGIDSGIIRCDNQVLKKDIEVLPNLGIILENAYLYPNLTGFRNLQLLSKINGKISDEEIKYAIERVGLDPNDKRRCGAYSLGMRKRIVLAQAIMERPDVLLLDEAGSGLDEEGVERFHNIVLEEKKRGALILLTSHVKEDMELMAEQIYYMKDGRLTADRGE